MNNPGQNDLNAVMQRGYAVDIGGFISRGWEIFQQNLGGFVGYTLLMFLALIVLSFIPIIGSIGVAIISGPLLAGFYIVAFKLMKGQPVEFGDFFKGFQNTYFLPVFLTSLVSSLLMLICYLPGLIMVYGSIIAAAATDSQPNVVLMGIGGIILLIGLIGVVYLSVSYVFAIPLVIGKKMQFWPAMESSRKLIGQKWLSFFAFGVVLFLVYLAGAIACGIGIFFTIPICLCSMAAAYENIIGLPTFDPSQA
ncbi:MAG: hypothetical protein HC851_24955 [Acaryochloris sp. RU_4_1]|nr:hypothetical protein [Acaryochloris sp. RU_4_1]